MLEIEINRKDQLGIIKLKGELDIATAEDFKEAVEEAIKEAKGLLIDFSMLEFLDSTGVGALLQVIRGIQGNGLNAKVVNIKNDIFEVLDLLGIPELVGRDNFEIELIK